MKNDVMKQISLKELAALLGLSQSTVSRVVSGGPDAHRISEQTRERVLKAAAEHNYTANAMAKSLRQKVSYTIGVIVAEISEGYYTAVLGGIEDELLKNGYFYFVVSHRHREDLLAEYPRMLLSRSIDGLIAVDTPLTEAMPIPVVAVSGSGIGSSSVRIELDHMEAARIGLTHLKKLGHERIAFIKGQKFSSDTERRWQAIVANAEKLGMKIDPKLVVQLQTAVPDTTPGHKAVELLLRERQDFTALFAFNDLSAIGAIQALREAGKNIPEDVSVLGFDDVLTAASTNPPLTTIHQPLHTMGQRAASTLLKMIRKEEDGDMTGSITVHPRLVVRSSTASASTANKESESGR